MQGLVLQTEGALGVGLVNAARGATVSVMAALLFCKGDPTQCLTPRTALSAAIITAGALGWVAAGQLLVSLLFLGLVVHCQRKSLHIYCASIVPAVAQRVREKVGVLIFMKQGLHSQLLHVRP